MNRVLIMFPDHETVNWSFGPIPATGEVIIFKHIKYIVRSRVFDMDAGDVIIYVDFA